MWQAGIPKRKRPALSSTSRRSLRRLPHHRSQQTWDHSVRLKSPGSNGTLFRVYMHSLFVVRRLISSMTEKLLERRFCFLRAFLHQPVTGVGQLDRCDIVGDDLRLHFQHIAH